MRNIIFPVILSSIFLGGCGAIFGGSSDSERDIDNMLTRPATEQEDALMDKCLHHIFNRQKYTFMKHGRYLADSRFLNSSKACDNNISLKLSANGERYVVHATLKADKNKVHYSMTESGEVFEHNDMGFTESF